MPKRVTGMNLEIEHIEKLDCIAKAKGVSRNTVVRWAVEAYLRQIF